MSLADIQARAQSKAGMAGSRRAKYFREAEQAKRIANLTAAGYVLPLSEWLGHNNGPPWHVATLFLEYCWRKAHEEAWKTPTQEIAARRARKAEALRLTYKQYALEIMERGRFPDEALAAQLKLNAGTMQ
jgi:hypothetical protein